MSGAAPDIGVRIKASGSDEIREQFRLISRDAEDHFGRIDRAASGTGGRLTSIVSQSTGAVGSVTSAVGGVLDSVRNAGEGIARVFSFGLQKVVETSGQFAAAGGIAGAGILGLVYAGRSYTQTVADMVSNTSDLAAQLGLSTEAFTKMQASFRVEGGDGDKFGQGLTTLKGKIVSLAEGNQAAIDTFSELGLSMQNFRDGRGNLLGTRQQLDLVLDRIERIKNPTLQAKAVMDVFGQSAAALGELATKGSAGLREAEKDVAKYGTTVDDATEEAFEEGLGNQAKLTESLRGLGMTLSKVFFPFFSASAEKLSDWLNNNRDRIEHFLERIRDAAESLKETLTGLFTGKVAVWDLITGGRRNGDRGSDDEDADEDPDAPARSRGAPLPLDPDAPAARSRFPQDPVIDPSAPAARSRGAPPPIDPDAPAARSRDFDAPTRQAGALDTLRDRVGKAKESVLGALVSVGAQASLAIGAIGSYVSNAFGAVTGNFPTFAGMLRGVSDAFRDFRLGLSRGFQTPWVQNIRLAVDDAFALLGKLGPVARGAWGILQDFLGVATGQLAGITRAIRRLPDAFDAAGPALEGALANGRLVLGGWLAWASTWGAEAWATVNGTWARIAAAVASFAPILGGILDGVRLIFDRFVSGTFDVGLKAAQNLTGAFSADRLNGLLSGGRGALDGFAQHADEATHNIARAFSALTPGDLVLNFGTAIAAWGFLSRNWVIVAGGVVTSLSSLLLRGGTEAAKNLTEGLARGASASPVSAVLGKALVGSGTGAGKGVFGTLLDMITGFVGGAEGSLKGLTRNAGTYTDMIVAVAAGGALRFLPWWGKILSIGGAAAYAFGRLSNITGATTKDVQAQGAQLDQVSARIDGHTATIEKAGLPLVLGAAPSIGARLFGRNWAYYESQLAFSLGSLGKFSSGVTKFMANVGEKLGILRPGGDAAVGGGIIALGLSVLYTSGALDVMRAIMLTVTVALAAVFYSLLIVTIGLKFFVEGILLGSKLFMVFFNVTSAILEAMVLVFTRTFAFILARATAFYVAMAARAAAFWAFMSASPLLMVVAWALVIAAIAAGVYLIYSHFGSIRGAWDALCDGVVAAWRSSMNVVGATSDFLAEIWEEGFFATMGKLMVDLWHGFANLGIWAWNQIKQFTGLSSVFGQTKYYGSDEEIQDQYNESLKKLGLVDKDGNSVARERSLPGMPEAPKRRAVKDDNKFAADDDIITGSDGQQRPKREEMARLNAEADKQFRLDTAAYKKERGNFLRKHERERLAAIDAGEDPQTAGKSKKEEPGVLDTLKKALLGDGPQEGPGAVDALKKALLGQGPAKADGSKPGAPLDGLLDLFGLGKKAEAAAPAEGEAKAPLILPDEDGDRTLMPGWMQRLEKRLQDMQQAPKGYGDPFNMGKRVDDADGEKPIYRKASLDLDGLFKGLGGGLDGRSEFSDGVPEPIILDARQREEVARRREAAEAGNGAGSTGTDDGGLKRVNLVIKPGDDAIYARQEGIDRVINALKEIGVAASTTEPARAI